MYQAMKKLIAKKFYKTAKEATDILDVFFAMGRINPEQYAELTVLAEGMESECR